MALSKKPTLLQRIAAGPRLPLEITVAASGPFVLHDFATAAKANPSWGGPISLLPAVIQFAFWVSLAVLVIISISRLFSGSKFKELQDRAKKAQELEDLISENINQLVNGILLSLAHQLALQDGDHSRLSLYVASEADQFSLLGRFSTNPNYGGAGRRQIPRGEGCLARAWGEGWHYNADLGSGAVFNQNCRKYGMSIAAIQALQMRPRTIAALRISDGNGQPLAALVFECTKANRFGEIALRDSLKQFSVFFEHAIPKLQPHIPQLNTAADRGF